MSKNKSIIRVRNVKRNFTVGEITVRVLKGISFAIKKGEFVTITGASGSGKTTLFNQIGLIDKPTSGKVFIDGMDTSKLNTAEKTQFRLKKIGRVFQFFNLLPELTVLENIKLPMLLAKVSEKEATKRAMALLNLIGLEHRIHNKPSQISGGQMQLVSIARALANEPTIILADEPTGNLDTRASQYVVDLFRRINKEEGQTIVMITHEKNLAEQADRTIHLTDGKIVTEEEFTLEFVEARMASMINNMKTSIRCLLTLKCKEEDIAHLETIQRAAHEIKYLDLKEEAFLGETKRMLQISLKKSYELIEKDMVQEELLEDKLDRICDDISEICGELKRDRKEMGKETFKKKLDPAVKKMNDLIKNLQEVDTKRELIVKKVRKRLAKILKKKPEF